MYAYQYNKKTYCEKCYMKIVPEDERKPGHVLDGNRFYEKYQDRIVMYVRCSFPLYYHSLYTTTDHSLGKHDKEED